jgi:hypothetical protein
MTGRGWLLFIVACIVVIGAVLLAWPAHARDLGQWGRLQTPV